jgi:hypothetical protein
MSALYILMDIRTGSQLGHILMLCYFLAGWFVGPGAQSADKGTISGFSCSFCCYGNLAGIYRPMVPQSLPVPPPLFLHHSHKVGLRIRITQMSGFIVYESVEIFLSQLWNKLSKCSKRGRASNPDESEEPFSRNGVRVTYKLTLFLLGMHWQCNLQQWERFLVGA